MVVITSPAPPGVVIQPDGHDATRFAMTRMGSLGLSIQALGLGLSSRDDNRIRAIGMNPRARTILF